MKKEPLFFNPIFKDRIWGGEQLISFGYDIPTSTTGECWAFAAHPNGQSVVKNGEYKGLTLGELWEKNRELFGDLAGERFPLLTKILDANQDLSVQVHPNDEYALIHEKDLGKTECWYIVDCKEKAEIIFGHHANSKEELTQMIENGDWNKLLRKVLVKKGDFYFVPSGTIHAIGEGIIILETQQNSDTTYRVYDYDRRDQEGNTRELHIEQSINVTTVPSIEPDLDQKVEQVEDLTITTFVECDYFTVHKWQVNGKATLKQNHPFLLVSVIDGHGNILQENYSFEIKKGDHFLLPYEYGEFVLKGHAELIVSHL